MCNENIELPEFPCKSDMWDELSAEKRHIVVYGMGNGADKLIERCEKYGIKIADFFASDGFVRGHSFHGMRVKSFSEIKETYDDFVILLSFASNRDEVIEMLCEIDGKYDMYVPDMPVAGVDEYFDREFFNLNYTKIRAVYDMLEDDESKKIYASVINYKLTGRMKFLVSAYTERDKMYSLLPCENIFSVVDAGAYNGDTLKEAKAYFPNLRHCIAIEPDARNFKKLEGYCEAELGVSFNAVNSAVWSCDGIGEFSGSGNRNSTLSSTASFRHKDSAVSLVKIDSLVTERVDYIKYDVEGAEREALIGSRETIEKYRPSLLVSAYHRSRDVFEIALTLVEKYPFYKIYLRRLKCLPAWELNVIAVVGQ